MAELAALVSPGPFKAKKKDPERMLGEFKDYIKAVKDMLVVTGKEGATAAVKKAMLRSVGGRTWCRCSTTWGRWRTRTRSTKQ